MVPGGGAAPPRARPTLPPVRPMELSILKAQARRPLGSGDGGGGMSKGGGAAAGAPSLAHHAAPEAAQTAEDFRSRRVLILVDVPHNGGATLDSTFGALKGWVRRTPAQRRPVDRWAVAFLVADSYPAAKGMVEGFGVAAGVQHIAPDADCVIVMAVRPPVERVAAAWRGATELGHPDSFPCDALRSPLRADPKHAGLAHLKRINEVEAGKPYITCQRMMNLQVKAALGLPRTAVVTEAHLEAAKRLVAQRNISIFLDDAAEYSMYSVMRAFAGGRGPPVTPWAWAKAAPWGDSPAALDDAPETRDVVYRENHFDAQFTQHAVERFYTDWAARHEAGYRHEAPCGAPAACWEDVGCSRQVHRAGLKTLKRLPPTSARLLKAPMCAAECAF
eukprot:TRINITY_DN8177_c0_g1_i1.p1 TRINITY_DN8177_c0_g1~~TRINITY_DN8177_c0_g1_i1.p1  ORF type:complete len:390 (+),score=114.46 TRINITY_DN8177_c0_g1_i1:66-1235(+)